MSTRLVNRANANLLGTTFRIFLPAVRVAPFQKIHRVCLSCARTNQSFEPELDFNSMARTLLFSPPAMIAMPQLRSP